MKRTHYVFQVEAEFGKGKTKVTHTKLNTYNRTHRRGNVPYEKAKGKPRHQVHGKERKNQDPITEHKYSNL